LGYDLFALEDTVLKFGVVTKVRTGIAVQSYRPTEKYAYSYVGVCGPYVEYGTEYHGLLIRDRSSMAAKGIVVSGGVIDHGYTGEISVLMTCNKRVWEGPGHYEWTFEHTISAGDKIAQMIPLPVLTGEVVEVEELGESSRGDKGFGSSGQ
jgi:dUTP pyrophosphatase